MTVSADEIITAVHYEALRNKVTRILGAPTGTWSTGSIGTTAGYNQTVSAPVKLINDTITSTEWNAVRSDIIKCYVHQIGNEPQGADELPIVNVGDTIDAATYNLFESLINVITAARNTVATTQRSLSSATTGTLTAVWNGQQTHAFTMTWNNVDHKKGWINAGGTLRFTASSSGAAIPYAGAPVISVIDEDSATTLSKLTDDWTTFRNYYPNRDFYLLQPQTSGAANTGLKIPSNFASDPNAYGPISVNQDDGNTGQASDWFAIADLGSLSPGETVTYFVDNSGSLTKAKVQASIDLLQQKCLAAGLNLVEFTNPNENWIAPFLGSISQINIDDKSLDWGTIISGIGQVEINNMSMTKSNFGSFYILQNGPTYNGWWYLDALPINTVQTIYTTSGLDHAGYNEYDENFYEIKFLKRSDTQYEFRVLVNDADTGDPSVDENVNADITSTIQVFTATGAYVSLDVPVFAEKTPTNTFNYT